MSAPDRDQFNWISQEVIDAHIAADEVRRAADDAAWAATKGAGDDEGGDEEITDPGDFDGGFGSGSYFERAMSKDD